MQIETIKEIRKGCLVFKVLRSRTDGKRFVGVDRVSGQGVIRGPLLLERNFWRLWRVLGGNFAALSSQIAVNSRALPADEPWFQWEKNRIPNERNEQEQKTEQVSSDGITVLPTIPEYRYVHTCPQCGCHVASHVQLDVGVASKICSGCGYGYPVSE